MESETNEWKIYDKVVDFDSSDLKEILVQYEETINYDLKKTMQKIRRKIMKDDEISCVIVFEKGNFLFFKLLCIYGIISILSNA